MAAVGSCSTANWQHILVFFSANYFAHAASVPTPAGTTWRDVPRWPLLAAFLPFAGLGRSISLIFRYIECGFRQGDLKRAFVSNAIAVVARSPDWEPPDNEQLFLLPAVENYDKRFSQSKPATVCFDYFDHAIPPTHFSIHGSSRLPRGYRLVSPTLPDLDYIVSNELEPMPELQLSRSQSWAKAIISIAQLVLSSVTIYRARGDQLDRYGYAAYGLSVFPYTFMSFINLVCVALVGEYPSIYLLRSRVMKEAEGRQGVFHGVIGTLQHTSNDTGGSESSGIHLDERSFTAQAPNDACNSNVNVTHSQNSTTRNTSVKGLVGTGQDHTLRQTTFKFRMSNASLHKQLLVTTDGSSKVFRFQKSAGRNGRNVHRFPLPSAIIDRFVDGDRRAGWIINLGRGMMIFPLLLLPHLLIYHLTGFKKEHSTVSQRGWMMAWICANQVSYFPVAWMSGNKPSCQLSFRGGIDTAALVSLCFLLSIPAVGGYVEVWRMISESAQCAFL